MDSVTEKLPDIPELTVCAQPNFISVNPPKAKTPEIPVSVNVTAQVIAGVGAMLVAPMTALVMAAMTAVSKSEAEPENPLSNGYAAGTLITEQNASAKAS